MNEYIKQRLSHLTEEQLPSDWCELENEKHSSLLEFYNVTDESIDEDDLQILADLANGITGSITWVDCDECGEELCLAYPNDWSNFQGVICDNESNYLQDCCLKIMSCE